VKYRRRLWTEQVPDMGSKKCIQNFCKETSQKTATMKPANEIERTTRK
jgi:hypothetical protein